MSDIINVRKALASLQKQEAFDGFSRVVIAVSDDLTYTSGNDTGRTLTLTCPWGTQQMANDILGKIRGFQYQPYTASDAQIDPAAEIGDGLDAGNIYSGVFSKDVSHGHLYTAGVAAPGGEKINYTYPYKSPETRKIERQYAETKATFGVQSDQISAEVSAREALGKELRSTLQIQADAIDARVSKNGGSTSFSWTLDAESWTLRANGSDVFKATKDGIEVTGIIRATGGKIGGFDIQSDYLSYNGQTWGGTNSQGAYIGSSGIQLGKNFRVDMYGNLEATSGKFSGTVKAGRIEYGGESGYLSGGGIQQGSIYGGSGGQIASRSISTVNTTGGINASLGYADFSNGVFNNFNRADYVACRRLDADYSALLPENSWIKNGDTSYKITPQRITVGGKTYRVLTI